MPYFLKAGKRIPLGIFGRRGGLAGRNWPIPTFAAPRDDLPLPASVHTMVRPNGVGRTQGGEKIVRKLFAIAVLCVLAVAGAANSAPALEKADLDSAHKYLETTRKNIEEATKGLSDAQWNFKSAPDRWSVAEVMEHIALAEDYLRGFVESQVLKAPAAPDRDVKKIDAMVLAMIPDRSHKFQAPKELQPDKHIGTPAETLKHFLESRAKTEVLLKDTPDLRDHAIDSPMGQKLDAYEWILFIAAHSDRHTQQMREVEADPNFPKK